MAFRDGVEEYLGIQIGEEDEVSLPIEDHNYDPEVEVEETFGVGQLARYRGRPAAGKITGQINFLVSAPMLDILGLALPSEGGTDLTPFEVDDGELRLTGCLASSLKLSLEEYKDLRATLAYTAKEKAESTWTPVAPGSEAFDAFFCETEGFTGLPDLVATKMDLTINNALTEHHGMKARDTRLPSHLAANDHKVEGSVDYLEDPGYDLAGAVVAIPTVTVVMPDAAGNKLTITLTNVLPKKSAKAAKRGETTQRPFEFTADDIAFGLTEVGD